MADVVFAKRQAVGKAGPYTRRCKERLSLPVSHVPHDKRNAESDEYASILQPVPPYIHLLLQKTRTRFLSFIG